jgi:hypothetical protein
MFYWWQRIAAFSLACAAFQLLLACGVLAEPYTAEEMASECRALLASAKATADPDAVELENTFSTGACWGAFLSIQQFVTLKADAAKNPMFDACVPVDVTLVQLIKLFASYAKAHPVRDGEPFTVVALAAIRETFQCSGGKMSSIR